MTLSGNIGSFPLSEVLRLAARSRQSGLLRVESDASPGNVYFSDGLLSYASIGDDDQLGDHLARVGIVDPHLWYPVERGEESIHSALVDGQTKDDVHRFLAERVSDVLVRLSRLKQGRFEFTEDSQPTYETELRLQVDEVLMGVEARAAEWADIEAVIPVGDATIHIAAELDGRDEITIDADTWRILAALATSSTVDGVADATGLSDFLVARTMAELVRRGLLEVRVGIRESSVTPLFVDPQRTISIEAEATEETVAERAEPGRQEVTPSDDVSIVELIKRSDDSSGSSGW